MTRVHELPFAAADARVFVSVAEAGSFAAAAMLHAMSPSAVSKTIRRLEDALGTQLLQRTTRSLHLTDEGRRFHELTARAFGLLAEAVAETDASARAIKGLVRLGMPPLFGTHLMPSVFAALRARHPDLELEIVSTMRLADLVDRGLDLVITVGDVPDSSFLTRPLGRGQFVVVAAPAYLKAHSPPRTPRDLAKHTCLGYVAPDQRLTPFFFSTGPVTVDAPIRSDEMHHLAAFAEAGLGIAQLPLFVVNDALAAGRLVRLLENARPPAKLASIVHPAARALPRRVRVVLDELAQAAAPLPGTSRGR